MKKRIKGKLCDTETAKQLGVIHIGEFGDPTGYEEQLYSTKTKQNFLYGIGGSESKYPKPAIEAITDKQSADWLKDNIKSKPKSKK